VFFASGLLHVSHETGDEGSFTGTINVPGAPALVSPTPSADEDYIGPDVTVGIVRRFGERFDFDQGELVAGPSLQWRPQSAMHIDLALLAGFEKEPGETEPLLWPWLVIGWEF